MNYYLIDLERSIQSGLTHYWGPNKRGYSKDLNAAGKYTEDQAKFLAMNDVDNRTIFVSENTVKRILSN